MGINMQYTKVEDLGDLISGESSIVTAMAAAEPQLFFRHVSKHPEYFTQGKTLYCANPSQAYGCFTEPDFDNLQVVMMFLTSVVRKHSGKRLQYFPHHLSQWARHLSSRGVGIFWGSCSLPDERGFVSLGPSCCYESEILAKAQHVVLEVNPNIPMTFGSTVVPVSDVDFFIESDAALPAIHKAVSQDIDRTIASFIADLVPDEATLQLGIGSIPNAIGEALEGKRNLGIHTEMVNDTMMELYQKGIVTGKCKTKWPSRIVGSFIFGTQKLYDFAHRNPIIELHPASVVNDPYRLGKNHRMISINTAVEIDLTGQVCSESVGHRELSGVGGASETHIGAQRSPGGRGIVALHSVTKDGQSKINVELKPGAKVSISRNDLDTVVTEYGVAHLKGHTVRERCLALISIAHPDFREQLREDGRRLGYI